MLDRNSLEKTVLDNMGLVYMVVKRFPGAADHEDLVQIGCLGLIKAARKYDPGLGYTFSTCAVPMIIGEIKRYLRDDGIVHVSRSIKENARKIEKIKREYPDRKFSLAELAELAQLGVDEVVTAMEATGCKNYSDYDTLQISSGQSQEERIIDHAFLGTAINQLDDEARRLIRLRYVENRTQRQVADIMNMNQVAVSRLEKKILLNIRNMY